ncbi:hypothetical protein PL321_10750 [Caloramator sp. mosi_1]|nr:hypothetical protein [Caloramator sp. mosi_1]WDC83263.1 hypothetical protein PL321_10750 [Caloramator sp. mosi_1]
MNRDKSYIKRSHERCQKLSLDKNLKYSRILLSQKELNDRLIRKRKLILAAIPFMNMLYDFVKGYDFFLILTDEEGCILNILGDQNILMEAFELKMIPGAFMSEEAIGTNAMGTALKEKGQFRFQRMNTIYMPITNGPVLQHLLETKREK